MDELCVLCPPERHLDTIVLDSGSSVDLFCNEEWLNNVNSNGSPLTMQTNGGGLQVAQQGHLPQCGVVPCDAKAMTNILSLGMMSNKCRITMDTAKENAILVHTPNKIVKFSRNDANLCVHVPTKPHKPGTLQASPQASLVQSVEECKLFHTPREVQKAKRACDLPVALGTPSIADLKKAISVNAIANLPVKVEDLDLAAKIFGPDVGTLKGKTTRIPPLPTVTDQIEMPPESCEDRSSWEPCMDLMFVNGMPFMTSITRKLHYRTAQHPPSQTSKDSFCRSGQCLPPTQWRWLPHLQDLH